MLAVFIAQDLFTLCLGLVLLFLHPFSKAGGANPLWVAAGSALNIVQSLAYTALAY